MKGLWARRGLRLFCAAAAVAAVAAGATYATTSLTTSAAATNTIQACVKDNGDVRIVASAADCKRPEHAISWNVVGPAGPAGPAGPTGPAGPAGPVGAPGTDGTSVVSSPADAAACPYGGAKFVVGTAAPTFACNGAPGRDGKDGSDGKDGTSLSSIDGLGGLTCTTNGQTGTVSVAYGSGGAISLTCSAGGGSTGGGGTGCTPQGVANGTLNCDGSVTCNPGFANADNDPSNGCELNVGSDPDNCGAPGVHVQPLPHATTGCINGHAVLIACDQGWFDSNHNPADGCESQLPSCESVVHNDGFGDTFPSCEALGAYSQQLANEAAVAWIAGRPGFTTQPGTCINPFAGGTSLVLIASDGTTFASWSYSGGTVGHATSGSGSFNGPVCPASSDPIWR